MSEWLVTLTSQNTSVLILTRKGRSVFKTTKRTIHLEHIQHIYPCSMSIMSCFGYKVAKSRMPPYKPEKYTPIPGWHIPNNFKGVLHIPDVTALQLPAPSSRRGDDPHFKLTTLNSREPMEDVVRAIIMSLGWIRLKKLQLLPKCEHSPCHSKSARRVTRSPGKTTGSHLKISPPNSPERVPKIRPKLQD